MTPPKVDTFEHQMIYVEDVDDKGKPAIRLTAVAVNLNPQHPPTLRELSSDDVKTDIATYVEEVRASMNKVCRTIVDQVLAAGQEQKIAHDGFVDLVFQLQDAPHLLVANMLAALLSGTAAHVSVSANPAQ